MGRGDAYGHGLARHIALGHGGLGYREFAHVQHAYQQLALLVGAARAALRGLAVGHGEARARHRVALFVHLVYAQVGRVGDRRARRHGIGVERAVAVDLDRGTRFCILPVLIGDERGLRHFIKVQGSCIIVSVRILLVSFFNLLGCFLLKPAIHCVAIYIGQRHKRYVRTGIARYCLILSSLSVLDQHVIDRVLLSCGRLLLCVIVLDVKFILIISYIRYRLFAIYHYIFFVILRIH